MGLLDEIRAEHAPKGPPCGVGLFVATLDPGDAAELGAACADPTCTSAAIARVLTRRGFKCTGTTVGRHRKRVCACP